MSCWADGLKGLVDRPAGGRFTDASPEAGDSSAQVHKSYNDIVSAGSGCFQKMCQENVNGEQPDNGAVWFHNTEMANMTVGWVVRLSNCTLASLPQGTGVARNKAQDRAHGIHNIMEYREDHKLPCVEHYMRII